MKLLVVLPLLAILLSWSAILLTALFRSQGSLSSDIQQQSARAHLAVQLCGECSCCNERPVHYIAKLRL